MICLRAKTQLSERKGIEKWKTVSKKTTVNAEQMTLKGVKSKTTNEVFVTLEHSEKMALELLIY